MEGKEGGRALGKEHKEEKGRRRKKKAQLEGAQSWDRVREGVAASYRAENQSRITKRSGLTGWRYVRLPLCFPSGEGKLKNAIGARASVYT